MRLVHPSKASGKKIVVIVGGGFAGLNAAKGLARNTSVHVILIDRRNHHLFQPLLYQVATAGLNPADIAVPIRAQFTGAANIEVHLAEITGVNLTEKVIQLGDHQLEYDYVILGCGAQHSYFSHPDWEGFAPGLKTLEQATEIRRRILTAFEAAENELDPKKQKPFMTFVIVGGGPTGVELAGAIADISRTVLLNDFRRIDPSSARVVLIEAGERLLSSFAADLSERARQDLAELGVEVYTKARVDHVDANGVRMGTIDIEAKNVFWAAGVQASRIHFEPVVSLDRSGRVLVEADLSIPGYPDVFVVGDMAAVKFGENGYVPGLAPAAIQEGQHASRMILADISGQRRKPFRYNDKGQMATIGKNRAVVQAGGLKVRGRLAWLAWLFIHVFYLIGFKNRFLVLFQWAWSYLFSKRGARLITEKEWRLDRHKTPESRTSGVVESGISSPD